ncbi:MAG: MarP family serine protease [Nocardioides sp.]
MNWIDWVLVVLVALYAVSGYWQGFITGAFATVGLLLGGAGGIWLAPRLLQDTSTSVWVSLSALFVVIVCASLGQVLLQWVGAKVRSGIRWQPARALDAVGGSFLSAAAVLVVAWALGVAVSGSTISGLSAKVRDSVILGAVNDSMPPSAADALDGFNNLVGTSFFPRYLEPFAPERIVAVGPGPDRMRTDPDVLVAGESVLKVYGDNKCGTAVEGSGWVISPNYVVTNAHVVAGVATPRVELGDSEVGGSVVAYDPSIDLALINVTTESLRPLDLSRVAEPTDAVAILGYPNDGPFDVQAGRIRSVQKLRSPDIYGHGTAIREVYSLRGLVRPGNSGGPVTDSSGDVVGVVFAASVTDPDTGYALTADQVDQTLSNAVGSNKAVSTGDCL